MMAALRVHVGIFPALLVGMLLNSCGELRRAIYIGVGPSAEQQVMAQVIKQIIEDQTPLAGTLVNCDNELACVLALQSDEVDLLLSYSGSGISFSPVRQLEREASLADVREAYAPLGIRWLGPLGFENDFLLAMEPRKAAENNITTITDLAAFPGGARFGMNQAFRYRPNDGFGSLIRFHGFSFFQELVVSDDPRELVTAALVGEADVLVVRATDSFLKDINPQILEDSLDFFPAYSAAIVARAAVMDQHPGLEPALNQLAHQFSAAEIQVANFQVALEGKSPGAVAYELLQERDLLSARARQPRRQPELDVTLDGNDDLTGVVPLALSGIRAVYPDNAIVPSESADPIADLAQGKARLAIISAERLFQSTPQPSAMGALGEWDPRAEVVAALTSRYLVLVRREQDRETDPLQGRLGIPDRGSGGRQLAEAALQALGVEPAADSSSARLLEQVREGQLDGALLISSPIDPSSLRDLIGEEKGELELRDLPALPPELPPYFREFRIPRNTYPNQRQVVQTIAAQVLIAGPSPTTYSNLQIGGPAGSVRAQNIPVTLEQARQLNQALAAVPGLSEELPNPVLPTVLNRIPSRRASRARASALSTLLNIVLIGFLGWALRLLVKPSPPPSNESMRE